MVWAQVKDIAMIKPAKRYPLNSKQLHLLKLIYKFRFIDNSLLANYLGIANVTCFLRLKVLLDQDYIASYYEPSYKLLGKGAVYYLTVKSINLFKNDQSFNNQVLHAMRKNNIVSEPFIDHNVIVMKACLALKHQYPNTFHIFTKSELGDYAFFPDPRPDLYLNRIIPSDSSINEYVFDVFVSETLFVIKKRVIAYIEHFESGEWEADAESAYPTILIVCPDSRIEANLQAQVAKVLDNMGIDDLNIYITTVKALISPNNNVKAVWSSAVETDRLISL